MNSLKKVLPIFAYALNPILSIMILPILTKSIAPETFGVYNYYITIINLILVFSFFPSINSYILRYLSKDSKNFRSELNLIIRVIVFSTILYLLISAVFLLFIKDLLATYLISVFYSINLINYYKNYLTLNGKKVKYSILSIMITIAQYAPLGIFYFYAGLNVYMLLLGNFLFNIIMIAILMLKYFTSIRPKTSKLINSTSIKNFKLFLIPSMIITLSGILLNVGDRILLKNLLINGDAAVGIYSVNSAVYFQVFELLVAIFYLYIPFILYSNFEKNGLEDFLNKLKRILKIYLISGLIILIFVYINFQNINSILFDQRYLSESKISLYILLGSWFYGIFRIISSYFIVTQKINKLSNIIIIISVLNVILNLILIPNYEVTGAAIATTICYLILMITIGKYIYDESNINVFSRKILIIVLAPLIIIVPNKEFYDSYIFIKETPFVSIIWSLLFFVILSIFTFYLDKQVNKGLYLKKIIKYIKG